MYCACTLSIKERTKVQILTMNRVDTLLSEKRSHDIDSHLTVHLHHKSGAYDFLHDNFHRLCIDDEDDDGDLHSMHKTKSHKKEQESIKCRAVDGLHRNACKSKLLALLTPEQLEASFEEGLRGGHDVHLMFLRTMSIMKEIVFLNLKENLQAMVQFLEYTIEDNEELRVLKPTRDEKWRKDVVEEVAHCVKLAVAPFSERLDFPFPEERHADMLLMFFVILSTTLSECALQASRYPAKNEAKRAYRECLFEVRQALRFFSVVQKQMPKRAL
jgi:hypothetical protein